MRGVRGEQVEVTLLQSWAPPGRRESELELRRATSRRVDVSVDLVAVVLRPLPLHPHSRHRLRSSKQTDAAHVQTPNRTYGSLAIYRATTRSPPAASPPRSLFPAHSPKIGSSSEPNQFRNDDAQRFGRARPKSLARQEGGASASTGVAIVSVSAPPRDRPRDGNGMAARAAVCRPSRARRCNIVSYVQRFAEWLIKQDIKQICVASTCLSSSPLPYTEAIPCDRLEIKNHAPASPSPPALPPPSTPPSYPRAIALVPLGRHCATSALARLWRPRAPAPSLRGPNVPVIAHPHPCRASALPLRRAPTPSCPVLVRRAHLRHNALLRQRASCAAAAALSTVDPGIVRAETHELIIRDLVLPGMVSYTGMYDTAILVLDS
ncbi:hypothetical protein EVG20_g5223 [Dentipellis fragilis]|uniref:Uncharacterized protein n=1 Tax=Dentipellis fragilis TaxID=205917 RepID=A0A4Y9YVV7_9AGAM|nr:hypothetical protein EVG20_g5223 [Dentipellis fragilis]